MSTHIATSLLSRAHSPTTTTQIFTEKIQSRPLLLKPTEGNPASNARHQRHLNRLARSTRLKKQKPAPLSAKERRSLGIHAVPSSEQKHDFYVPLQKLWIAYIQDILGMREPRARITGDVAGFLVSADFHGAELEVVRSRCVSRVGVKGIVVRDSRFAFRVITRANVVKLLPKEHTVFRFEVPWPSVGGRAKGGENMTSEGDLSGMELGGKGGRKAEGNGEEMETEMKKVVFELHGDQFQFRAADRAKHKFKLHFYKNL